MRFLVIGNLTKDTIRTKEKEIISFGGTSSYASITARKLGCETYVLSRGNHELDEWIRNLKNQGIKIDLQESECVTHFINDYTGKKRKQFCMSDAGKIDFKYLGKMDIIHLGPVFNEITLDCVKEARKNAKLVSLDVQGFIRSLNKERVTMRFWNEATEFLKYVDLVKLNVLESSFVSEKSKYEEICNEILGLGPKVIKLTMGSMGSVIMEEETHRIPAYETNTVDKTGSGDVFSTTFDIYYLETKNPLESGLFASAAASFVVEDFGTKNIKDKNSMLERFRELKDSYDKSNHF
jgi:sugar/nucleoside kinase (ribokinase family)